MCTKADQEKIVDTVDIILEKVFEKVFNITEFKDDGSMETVPLWDSMGHMELMVALEESYSIRIEPEDIISLTSVAALKKYLRNKV